MLMKKMFFVIAGAVFCLFSAIAEDGPSHECTSWMIFSDLTKNNTNILHKSRDSSSKNVTVLSSPAGAARKWIGLGSAKDNKIYVNMGMNVSGLAGVMNSGEKCIDNGKNKNAKTTPEILRHILENCDTAAQAVSELKKLLKAKDYWHKGSGSIFFFCDTKEGYICENTANFISVQRYEEKYALRANSWHNPGMEFWAANTPQAYINNSIRQFIVLTELNKAYRTRGKITVQDSLNLTRIHETPKNDMNLTRSICFKHTNSSSSFVIDRSYPDVLSTGWLCVGPPRNTVCIPVPVCVEKLDPEIAGLDFYSAARKDFDKRGFASPLPEKFTAFEKKAFEQYGKALKLAEILLKKGQKAQAVKVLNTQAAQIWKEAAKVLGIPEK